MYGYTSFFFFDVFFCVACLSPNGCKGSSCRFAASLASRVISNGRLQMY